MTPWEHDVQTALLDTARGVSENWDLTAHTLAAEVHRLRAAMIRAEPGQKEPAR